MACLYARAVTTRRVQTTGVEHPKVTGSEGHPVFIGGRPPSHPQRNNRNKRNYSVEPLA